MRTTRQRASSTPTNFPGAGAAQLTDARDLYALLTGRVAAVTGIATLDAETNEYTLNGNRRRAGKIDNYSGFVQDSWRLTPALTINAGLRWDVQSPFSPVNDTMSTASLASICGLSGLGDGGIYTACNFFDPGSSGGATPEFVQFTSGTRGYNVDWNNFAPNVGVAWRPNVQDGWLRKLLGDPEQATLRGGYSVAYERQGFAQFTGIFGVNPGSTISVTRDANTGLVPPGQSWPVLLRETNRLTTLPLPAPPTYPIAIRPNRADDIAAFHPDIEIASARSWTVGFQRAVGRDMAVELRYVGTRGVNQWSTLNYNELNVIENGFYDEFLRARANLLANNLAGGSRAGSFAYFGPGTGTNPLPIYLAYLNASRNANDPAAYATNIWTNTGLTGDMGQTNAQPFNSAGDLDNDQGRRTNARNAGLAANFFIVNPDIDDVNVVDSGAFSDYHALQFEVRRRLSRGFAFNASYQYAIEGGSAFQGFHYGRVMNPTANVRHAIKGQWNWTIPVGHGQRYGANLNPILNGVVGGWEFSGAARIQARMVNMGNVRLVGMSASDLQKMYSYPDHPGPGQSGPRAGHDAPGRRHPQHAARVQHQCDVSNRVLQSRSSRGPLHGAGEQRELHRAQGGRLRVANAPDSGAVLHARRCRRHEAVPDSRLGELRAARRRAEPVRQHQLLPGRRIRARMRTSSRWTRRTAIRTTTSIRAAVSVSCSFRINW